MAVSVSYLAKVKLAAGLTASTYDLDIIDLIESARLEMVRVGVLPALSISETDGLVRLAVRTFVQGEYAESEGEAVRLKESWHSQIMALSQTTSYGAEVVADEV